MKNNTALVFVLFTIFTSMSFPCSSAQEPAVSFGELKNYSELIEHIDALFDYQINQKKVAGFGIALIDNDKVILKKGYGLASEAEELTEKHALKAASISKLFTAIAVMQLVDAGLVDIDKPYSHYVSEFSIRSYFDDVEPFTIRQMLYHHSGMPANLFGGYTGGGQNFRQLPEQVKDLYLSGEPEQTMSYSNLSFSLLGLLIERVSGEEFTMYINQHILDPLGMNNSSFLIDKRVEKRLAKGFINGKDITPIIFRDLPAGGLMVSPEDISKFLMALVQQDTRLLKKNTWKEMFTRQNLLTPSDGNFKIGLGFWLSSSGRLTSLETVSHPGDSPPFHANLVAIPDAQLGITVFTNDSKGASAAHLLSSEILALAYEVKTGKKLVPQKIADKDPWSTDRFSSLAGDYATTVGLVSFRNRGNKLSITPPSLIDDLIPDFISPEFIDYFIAGNLVSHQNDQLSLEIEVFKTFHIDLEFLKHLIFYDTPVGDKHYLVPETDGLQFGENIKKITPPVIEEYWKDRVGIYTLTNKIGTTGIEAFRVRYHDDTGYLLAGPNAVAGPNAFKIFNHPIFLDYPIKPVNKNLAVIMGEGSNRGEAIEFLNENEIAYSGYIFEKTND